jgi:HAD superfamily hydrolase (TIGR01458 family)
VTAVVATAAHLRERHPGAGVYLLSDGDARADLHGVRLVEDIPDVVVLGGASDAFGYDTIDRVFRWLMDGASLVAMHRNLYWKTRDGWHLDGGAYVAALEEATGRPAFVCGKPSPAAFDAALGEIGVERSRALMVGDDVMNDVLGAQALGIDGALVRTGKFRPEDLESADEAPSAVVDSVADLPRLLDAARV